MDGWTDVLQRAAGPGKSLHQASWPCLFLCRAAARVRVSERVRCCLQLAQVLQRRPSQSMDNLVHKLERQTTRQEVGDTV